MEIHAGFTLTAPREMDFLEGDLRSHVVAAGADPSSRAGSR